MVSLLIVSHSEKLANGVKELAKEMASDVNIEAVGGNEEGGLGSDYNKIFEALDSIYTSDGVIILFDLGSSLMTTQIVMEILEAEGKKNIVILDAPIVEGAVVAAVEISIGQTIQKVVEKLKPLKMGKIK